MTVATLAVSAGLSLVSPGQALGFGTINAGGQHAEHERITRAALACPPGAKSTGFCFEPRSIDQLAGHTGTFGAVGSPDITEIFDFRAHCDDADFLAVPGYRGFPSIVDARRAATATLAACVQHLQGRFQYGIAHANGLLTDRDRISRSQTTLLVDCTFVPTNSPGRAKCEALEGFGRALHGAQDFYSHSNWSDQADPSRPISVTNPPGLGLPGPAPLLSLRATGLSPALVPPDLSTGCFVLPDRTPGVKDCTDRITHHTLNKDLGLIDASTGATTAPTTDRGRIGTNFDRAVQGAIAETRRQWQDFQAELLVRYGPRRGGLMICALTRDDPVKDCMGRRLAIVVDSSGSNQDTDPSNQRITAAAAFNDSLVSAAEAGPDGRPDESAVIDFDDSARVISPLADPTKASFAGIDSEGGTFIAGGVLAAIGELTKDPSAEPAADRSGIVVFTDGLDPDVDALNAAVDQARSLGIRVNIGFLTVPDNPVPLLSSDRADTSVGARSTVLSAPPPAVDAPDTLVTAVLKTGGMIASVSSPPALQSFVDAVSDRGPTNMDDPNGTDDGGPLVPGVTITGLTSASQDTDTYAFVQPNGPLPTISVAQQSAAGPTKLTLTLRDIRRNSTVRTTITGAHGAAEFTVNARAGAILELDISGKPAKDEVYTVLLNQPTASQPPAHKTQPPAHKKPPAPLPPASNQGEATLPATGLPIEMLAYLAILLPVAGVVLVVVGGARRRHSPLPAPRGRS